MCVVQEFQSANGVEHSWKHPSSYRLLEKGHLRGNLESYAHDGVALHQIRFAADDN